MTKQPPVRILGHGDRGQVVALELPNGASPAETFLAELPSRPQAQFKAAIERLVQVGWLRSPDVMRILDVDGEPKVSEIKAHYGPGYRLYVVRRHTTWIATHGGPKPSNNRRVAAEVNRARELLRRWES